MPLQSGDNSLIEQLNSIRKTALAGKEKAQNEHGFMFGVVNAVRGGNLIKVQNPLFDLGERYPEVAKHIESYSNFSKITNRLVEQEYDKLGFVTLSAQINLPSTKEVQDQYVNQIQSLVHKYYEKDPKAEVKEVTGFTSLPNGQIRIMAKVNMGQEKGQTIEFDVPRSGAGSLGTEIPADEARSMEQYLSITQGTTTNQSKAPTFAFKKTYANGSTRSVVVPYRIYKESKEPGAPVLLQFFNKQGKIIQDPTGRNKFSSLQDLYRNGRTLAEAVWEANNLPQQNQTQTQTYK